MSLYSKLAALSLLSGVSLGCVGAPEAPPETDDLTELYRAYERPTAILPIERVRGLIAAAVASLGPEHAFAGLHFVRDGFSEANRELAARVDLDDFELGGRVDANVRCPGYDALTPREDDGRVAATFGVENSHLRRGFAGTLDDCRFSLVTAFGENQRVRLDARYTADLGTNLRLGSPLPAALLVHLKDVTGTSDGERTSVDLTRDEYHLRLTADSSLEVLLDSVTLTDVDLGSVVVVLGASGSVGLRESRGLWACGETSTPCVLY